MTGRPVGARRADRRPTQGPNLAGCIISLHGGRPAPTLALDLSRGGVEMFVALELPTDDESSALAPGLYERPNGSFCCHRARCCGSSIFHTGRGLYGAAPTPVPPTAKIFREFPELTCECQRLARTK